MARNLEEYKMAFDPISAQLEQSSSKSGFDPMSAELEQTPQSQNTGLLQSINDNPAVKAAADLVTPLNAAVGSAVEGAGQAVGTALNRPNPVEPNDLIKEAQQENPITSTIGNTIGQAGVYGATATGLGEVAAGLRLGTGLLAQTGANAAAGAILGGENNRLTGAITGAGAGAIGAGVGKLSSIVTSAETMGTRLKNVVGDLNSNIRGTPDIVAAKSQANMWNTAQETENKLFDSFRNKQGFVDTSDIQKTARQFINDHGTDLDPKQTGIIKDLIDSTGKAESLADLHDARKALNFDFNKFNPSIVSDKIYKGFRNLVQTTNNSLESNANNLGVGQEFRQANDFFKNTILPLQNTGAKDTADALANAGKDPKTAAKITDNLINRYVNPNKPEITKAFLNTLDPTGRRAVETQVINKVINGSTSKAGEVNYDSVLNGINVARDKIGNVFSSDTNKMLDGLTATLKEGSGLNKLANNKFALGASGLGALELTAHFGAPAITPIATIAGLHGLAQTDLGQKMLIKVADSPNVQKAAKGLLNGLLYKQAIEYANQQAQPNM